MVLKGQPLAVISLVLVVLASLRLGYRQYYGQQDCEMTYMYRWPQYQEVPLPPAVEAKFPQYGLYLYYEGNVRKALPLPLQGIPALFLPGNAGSYKQARSSASIALRMHPSDFKLQRHFDFFTINFNEELSGMFGGVLESQTDYVVHCIHRILGLYRGVKPHPTSVVIIGHSMGGVVARALFTHPKFDHSAVTTIVALSSPLLRPVLTFDPLMQQFYDRIEEAWSSPSAGMSRVTLVSIAGGERDVMVPTHLSTVPMAVSLATPAIPRNWASADHLAVVWCRRVQLAVTRALFLLQDSDGGHGLSTDPTYQQHTFHRLLIHSKEVPEGSAPLRLTLERVWFTSLTTLYQEGYREGRTHTAVPLPLEDYASLWLLVASNTPLVSWVWLCSSSSLSRSLNCEAISSQCTLLPPKHGSLKVCYFTLSHFRTLLPAATHLLLASPLASPTHTARNKVFVRVHKCEFPPSTLHLPWFGATERFPPDHCPLLNLSLPQLTEMWQAYQVKAWSDCGGMSGGVVVPWYPHTPLANSTYSPLIISLSLLAPPPPQAPPPHLLLWSSPDCELVITITFDPLAILDKLAVVHAPLLLPWVMACSISASPPRWLALELLVLILLQLASSWLPLLSDWVELSRLWGGCGPIVLHLLSYGLQQALYASVGVAAAAARFLRGWRRGCSCVLIGCGLACLSVCSGLALLMAIMAVLLQVRDHPWLQEVVCVLVCFQLLVIPSLFTWLRALRYSVSLSPDPHWAAVLVVILLLSYTLFYTHQQLPDKLSAGGGSEGGVSSHQQLPDKLSSSKESGEGLQLSASGGREEGEGGVSSHQQLPDKVFASRGREQLCASGGTEESKGDVSSLQQLPDHLSAGGGSEGGVSSHQQLPDKVFASRGREQLSASGGTEESKGGVQLSDSGGREGSRESDHGHHTSDPGRGLSTFSLLKSGLGLAVLCTSLLHPYRLGVMAVLHLILMTYQRHLHTEAQHFIR